MKQALAIEDRSMQLELPPKCELGYKEIAIHEKC